MDRIVWDASGNVIARQDFTPFGEPVLQQGTAIPKEGFGGNETDAETNQDYFHARMFEARTGRLSRTDPIEDGVGEPQKWNRYAYALNAPIRFIDIGGLDPWWSDCSKILKINPDDSVCHPTQIAFAFPIDPSLNINVDAGSLNGHGGGGAGGGGAGVGAGGGKSSSGNGDSSSTSSDITVVVKPLSPVPKVQVCSGGAFAYAGLSGDFGFAEGELLAVAQYDSKNGGSHGGLLAAGVGPYTAGKAWMRRWHDWSEHDSIVVFGEQNLPGVGHTGFLAEPGDGEISFGVFFGEPMGADNRPIGLGGYMTIGVNCR